MQRLRSDVWGVRAGVPNNADKDSPTSIAISEKLALACGGPLSEQIATANTLGKRFAEAVADFLRSTLPLLATVRPGPFDVRTAMDRDGIANFSQYRHLREIREVLEHHPSLRTTLGTDYFVRPDIIVVRERVSLADLGSSVHAADDDPPVGQYTSLVDRTSDPPLLIASVSVKWTMRSDRAQNTRTEALNLIRHRKGHLPHIAAMTFEPVPARLASLANGTGDIDCVYHGALPELLAAVRAVDDDAYEQVVDLVKGNRLRDISDLPLDLAV